MKIIESSEHIALDLSGREVSYAELRDLVDQKKIELEDWKSFTLAQNDIPSLHFVVQFLAAMELGMSQVIFPFQESEREKWQKLKMIGEVVEEREDFLLLPKVDFPSSVILFTSGSHGESKGVVLGVEGILKVEQAVRKGLRFEAGMYQYLHLPLSYSYGLLGQLLTGLRAQMTIAPVSFIELIGKLREEREGVVISGVPSHFSALIDVTNGMTFPKVERVISAGAHLSLSLRELLIKRFPGAIIFNNYGQTELSPRALCLASDDPHFFSEASGYPIEGVEVFLRGDEIGIRSPGVALGYLGEQKLNISEQTLWTKDRATIDQSGLVTILGRTDLVVNLKGEKVPLVKIERILQKFPSVKKASVQLDPDREDHLMAFLEPHGEISKRQLLEGLKKVLPVLHIPTRFLRVEVFPLNQKGLIDRNKLENLRESYDEILE
jgi:long-chain acyl-CoA synthetase